MLKIEFDHHNFVKNVQDLFDECLKNDIQIGIKSAQEEYLDEMQILQSNDDTEQSHYHFRYEDTKGDNSYPLYYFYLTIKDEIIANILTYYKIVDNKIYYATHSHTKTGYEGQGYNTLLKAIYIISAKYLQIGGKHID